MTYRLGTIPHDWHSKVHNDPSWSFKVNDFHVMRKGLCDFLLIYVATLALSLTVFEILPFSVEKHTFFLPPPFNTKFEIVPLALHCPNFASKEP